MQKVLCLLLLATTPKASVEEELLFARRIIECWRDQDVDLAKGQIEVFLQKYPKSDYVDHFHAILGDIALQKQEYQKAIAAYETIKDNDLLKHVRTKRWHALYQLKNYAGLYQEISPLLAFLEEDEARFYFAEAAFREGLALDSLPDAAAKQKGLFEEALPVYRKLQNHEHYSDHVLLAMGEIFRRIGKYEEAASLYLKIANEKKSHQTLFHAATMLIQCDEKQACELFAQIAKGGGKKSQDAAYQWIQLLAKRKEWDTIVKERRCFLATLSQKHLPVYYFYLGMVHHDRNEWSDAIEAIQKSLNTGLKPPHDRSALLSLMIAAKEKPDMGAADFGYNLLKERYPADLEEGALLRAMAYRQSDQKRIALNFLTELIAMGEKKNILEDAYLEKTHVLIECKEWRRSHEIALKFLNEFPESKKKLEMIRLAVDLSLESIDQEFGYEILASDLERALSTPGVYDHEKEGKMSLLLAKCYLKLEKPQLANKLLSDLIAQQRDSSELHYLMSISLLKQGGHSKELIAHGEAALASDPEFKEADRLHLYLFNAYLEASKEEQDPFLTEKAAAHLYAVIDQVPISLENQLWLAHTYAKELQYHDRALKILEDLLPTPDKVSRFQDEALILAKLYEEAGSYTKALVLLENLHTCVQKPEITYKLGSVLAHLGCYEKAHDLFNEIENHPDSKVALNARLENARIGLKIGQEREEVLKKLRTLWVQKSLDHEPLHLEAAMDYADLSPKENLLEVLHTIKEHFISESDICSKDYHEERLANPEKDRIYQAYMRYLDARIGLAQADFDQKAGLNSDVKRKAAQALLVTLKEGKYAMTPYLIEKASERLD